MTTRSNGPVSTGKGELRHQPAASAGGDKQPSLIDVAKSAAEDLLDLLAAQIKLAKLELSADLRKAASRFARVALFLPPLLVGYGFAMAALASWLRGFIGLTGALATVAGLQILPAGAGIFWSLSALRRTHILERTSVGVVDSVQQTIASAAHHSAGPPHG